MSYVKKVLLPDERVVFTARLHWIIYIRGLVIAVCGGIAGFCSNDIAQNLFGGTFGAGAGKVLASVAFILTLVGVGLLWKGYMRQATTELVITNMRIIAKYGLISRATFEILISRITGANFDQTMFGRILDYGTILVHGAGGEISPFDMVADPQGFHRALLTVLDR